MGTTTQNVNQEGSKSSAIEGAADRPAGPVIAGVPAYNEEVAIGSVVHGVSEYVDEVVVVDDGSDDDTSKLARRAGATVLEHECNAGKGSAMRSLLSYAKSASYDALVVLDGDGQHLPDDIPNVVEPVLAGDADIVIGSRYSDDQTHDETPLYRRFGQTILDALTFVSVGANVSDSQSGFRAFSPTAVESLSLTTNGYGVETEMLSEATKKDLRIQERPINVRYKDVDGQTYNSVHHGIAVVALILQLIRDKHPVLFFGVPGIILTTVGTIYGVHAILLYQQSGVFYAAKVLTAGFVTIPGILAIFCGLVLNSVQRMITQSDTPG
ncbi:glycosyltransferase family 2 protein [Haloarcula sp. JP-L23]|uniref:glycosyltransferase family 2 protein n=1 Tax=Haloarcula sp. JP-L23 TaxID=2716717 RepID=UPI00140EAE2A|nr:glycosyltransferase family 2 protein [Haloarcula sp. JP-L23]